jgi:hypothetical protein
LHGVVFECNEIIRDSRNMKRAPATFSALLT